MTALTMASLANMFAAIKVPCTARPHSDSRAPVLPPASTMMYRPHNCPLSHRATHPFAAQGGENAKLMKTEGLKERIGGVGNQFAMTEVMGFFISIPVMVYLEGHQFGKFVDMFKVRVRAASVSEGGTDRRGQRRSGHGAGRVGAPRLKK